MKRLFCLFLAMICCLAFCSCDTRYHGDDKKDSENTSSVAKEPAKGHWELANKELDPNKDIITEHSSSLFTVNQTSHTLNYSYDDEKDVMNGTHFKGKYKITCNDLPQSYKVGDTVSFTVKAEVLSVTNKTHAQDFVGYAKFEPNLDFFNDGFDGKKVSAGVNRYLYPSGFEEREEHTYEKVLDKKYAGKMTYFYVDLITDAGKSSWRYDWVEDK